MNDQRIRIHAAFHPRAEGSLIAVTLILMNGMILSEGISGGNAT
jgi:hypothetical protein